LADSAAEVNGVVESLEVASVMSGCVLVSSSDVDVFVAVTVSQIYVNMKDEYSDMQENKLHVLSVYINKVHAIIIKLLADIRKLHVELNKLHLACRHK
jgi:hypothetical protein